jgi:RNA polymerase sigma-70 factor (ECF subfamily)
MHQFDEFYYGSYRRLLPALTLLCGSRAEAEDVLGHAYVAALESWNRVSRLERPEAWVRRVAMNKAVDLHRERSRASRVLHRLVGPAIAPEPRLEEFPELGRALRQLPEQQRLVLVLHYAADLSVAQIAGETGLRPGTVKAHLARGRTRLAQSLNAQRTLEGERCP